MPDDPSRERPVRPPQVACNQCGKPFIPRDRHFCALGFCSKSCLRENNQDDDPRGS
jgi:hypothetical protein